MIIQIIITTIIIIIKGIENIILIIELYRFGKQERGIQSEVIIQTTSVQLDWQLMKTALIIIVDIVVVMMTTNKNIIIRKVLIAIILIFIAGGEDACLCFES